jgi:hypothetical protein
LETNYFLFYIVYSKRREVMAAASAQEHALCDENRNKVRSVGAETFPFGGGAYECKY